MALAGGEQWRWLAVNNGVGWRWAGGQTDLVQQALETGFGLRSEKTHA